MTDNGDGYQWSVAWATRLTDLESAVEELRGEIKGMQAYFDKQEVWHKEQLAAAHLERNELRDAIREMRSLPPEERVVNPSDLTNEEKNLAMSGKTIDAIKSVRHRLHLDLRSAKAIIDGFLRGER